MNRDTCSAVRAELVEAAIRLLDRDGAQSLQARRITAAAGVSTMAVYTHFGGIPALLAEVATEAFARFGAALGAVAMTHDPVLDLFALEIAYREYALANPQRYYLMFGLTAQRTSHRRTIRDFTESAPGDALGAGTFDHIVAVVERMMAAGYIRRDRPRQVAARLWAMLHGPVLLELAGALSLERHGATTIPGPTAIDLLVGMGANRSHVEQSARTAYRNCAGTAWE